MHRLPAKTGRIELNFVKLHRLFLLGPAVIILLGLMLAGCGDYSTLTAQPTFNPASTATPSQVSASPGISTVKSATAFSSTQAAITQISTTIPNTVIAASLTTSPDSSQATFKGDNFATLTHSEQVVDLAWSPDGKTLTTMTSSPAGSTIKWWNSANGQEIALPAYLSGITSLKWLPDGRMLTLGPAACKFGECDKKLRLWSAAGQLLTDFAFTTSFIGELKWSPDLKWLAASSQFNSSQHRLWLWNMADGKLVATLEQSNSAFDWSPDSKRLAVAYYTFGPNTTNECGPDSKLASGVRVWSVEGKSVSLLCGYDSPLFNVAWSADGKTIATSSEDALSTNNVKTQGIVRLSSPEGQEKKRLYLKASFITKLVWSPDGKTLAVTARNGCYDCIVFSDGSDGGVVELWSSEGQKIGAVADTSSILDWSPDGKRLAVATFLRQETSNRGLETNARLIQLLGADGQLLKTLEGYTQSITKLSWSPDGTRLTSASADKTVKLWK